jgi:hypothetical protein
MENRNGLLVDISVAQADGYAEREEALAMVRCTRERQKVKIRTLGMDAGYDAGPFLHTLEHAEQVVPHLPTRAGKIAGQDEAADARRRASAAEAEPGLLNLAAHPEAGGGDLALPLKGDADGESYAAEREVSRGIVVSRGANMAKTHPTDEGPNGREGEHWEPQRYNASWPAHQYRHAQVQDRAPLDRPVNPAVK